MPWDGSGNFTRTNGDKTGATTWAQDRDVAVNITASRHDTHDQDLATGIAACLTKNNETKPTADFRPNSDNALDLGSAALRWAEGHIQLLNGGQGSDIASAATINLDTATGNVVDITGTTTITAVTLSQGRWRIGRFTGVLTLTHGASLILPGSANFITTAGDYVLFMGYASGVVRAVILPVNGAILPQNSQSAAYTTVAADANKHILHPTADNNARTFTIDSNANVPYPIGTSITFVNQINTVTIAITSDTLTLAGAGSTGSRTLAASGIATALKIAATSWIISGTGLT